MSSSQQNPPASPLTKDKTPANDVRTAVSATLPVTPARYAELQRNGLHGLAPERRYMRLDLHYSPHEDLAEVVENDLLLATER